MNSYQGQSKLFSYYLGSNSLNNVCFIMSALKSVTGPNLGYNCVTWDTY